MNTELLYEWQEAPMCRCVAGHGTMLVFAYLQLPALDAISIWGMISKILHCAFSVAHHELHALVQMQ